jgi:multidrug resistance efflux pump
MSTREAYENKLESQLSEWKIEIDKLKAKADKAEADVKIKYYKQIESLQAKQEAAREKLAELKKAGEDAWEDLKSGVKSAWDSMEEAMNSARTKI